MVKSRLLTVVLALGGVLCSEPSSPRSLVIVVLNSRQPRWVEPISCAVCEIFDFGSSALTRPPHGELLVLDGHSAPPTNILGVPETEIMDLVRQVAPSGVVAATCFGAELGFLEHLFSSSPSLDWVMASPTPLPWQGFEVLENCLQERGVTPDCIRSPPDVFVYDRASVARLRASADLYMTAISECERPRSFASRWPLYLCVEEPLGLYSVLMVPPGNLSRSCDSGDSPDDSFDAYCGFSRNVRPVRSSRGG